jgi:hypothetical protein
LEQEAKELASIVAAALGGEPFAELSQPPRRLRTFAVNLASLPLPPKGADSGLLVSQRSGGAVIEGPTAPAAEQLHQHQRRSPTVDQSGENSAFDLLMSAKPRPAVPPGKPAQAPTNPFAVSGPLKAIPAAVANTLANAAVVRMAAPALPAVQTLKKPIVGSNPPQLVLDSLLAMPQAPIARSSAPQPASTSPLANKPAMSAQIEERKRRALQLLREKEQQRLAALAASAARPPEPVPRAMAPQPRVFEPRQARASAHPADPFQLRSVPPQPAALLYPAPSAAKGPVPASAVQPASFARPSGPGSHLSQAVAATPPASRPVPSAQPATPGASSAAVAHIVVRALLVRSRLTLRGAQCQTCLLDEREDVLMLCDGCDTGMSWHCALAAALLIARAGRHAHLLPARAARQSARGRLAVPGVHRSWTYSAKAATVRRPAVQLDAGGGPAARQARAGQLAGGRRREAGASRRACHRGGA